MTWDDGVATSDCATWDPAGGQQVEVSCATWFEAAYGDPFCYPDGGVSYFVWWMQNLPGYQNGMRFGDEDLTNWWHPIARLDEVKDDPRWLVR